MTSLATAGAGFLLAVLWFDLMFDVQARGGRPSPEALASIAAYYRRVTIQATPMNRLVAVAMLVTVGALVAEVIQGDAPRWAAIASLALTVAAAGLALGRTFANGARLGGGRQPEERQIVLAHRMLADHLACLVAIVTVLVLQVGFAG